MKLSASTFKNFDYKQFGIDHGEKVGIAVIGLVLALSLWGTNWIPLDISPTELTTKTTEAKKKIEEQAWPADKQEELRAGVQLDSKVGQLMAPLDVAQLRPSIPFSSALAPDKQRISNPRWLPVEDLRADAGVAEILLAPGVKGPSEDFQRKPAPKEKEPKNSKEHGKKGEKKKKKDQKEKEKKEEEPIPDEFKPREHHGTGAGEPRGFGSGMGEALRKSMKARDKGKGDETPFETEAIAAATKPKQEGRGIRFVAVRGVYPLRNQVNELMRAMGEQGKNRGQVQKMIEFDEPCFKLERQVSVSGGNDWGPWEPVDREPVIEMLKTEAAGYATERVADGIIDPSICMPYPDLSFGDWGRFATHPQIEKFVLSDDEVEEQVKFEQKIIEKAKEEEDKKRADLKGWASVRQMTRNFRNLQEQTTHQAALPGGPAGGSVREQILQELEGKGNVDKDKIDERLRDFVRTRATPSEHLLLFRYLDVKVEPGKTYRYRVKLVLNNPFRNHNPDEVVDPSLLEGATRETEYSEPTKPVTVPEDARYFLTHVDSRIGSKSLPSVDLDLYQWFVSTGTVVNRKNVHVQIGQVIGGKESAQVLRPTDETYDPEKVPFATKEALVDVSAGFQFDPALHADIVGELKAIKGKKPMIGVPDQAVVVDDNGALSLLDSQEQDAAHHQTMTRYNQQIKAFLPIIKKDTDSDSTSGKLDLRGGGPLGKQKKEKRELRRKSKGKE